MPSDDDILNELKNQVSNPPPASGGEDEELLNRSASSNYEIDTVIPVGEYIVKFAEVKVQLGKEKRDPKTQQTIPGTPFLNCVLEITTGEFEGKKIFEMIMLEGKGATRLARLASVLGFYDRDNKCLSGFPVNPPTYGMIRDRVLNSVCKVKTAIVKSEWPINSGQFREQCKVEFAGFFPIETTATTLEQAPSWE